LLAASPSHTSVWQRYYLDVFFVVIAAILLFELRERGLVDVDTNPGLDPFAVASPALFLFAGALVLLRVLPYLLRGLGWAMTRLRGMAAALPGWHMGRNPVPYGRLALLIFLTTGFGAFALTYAQTLERSYDDRSGFAAGAEARLVGDGVGLLPLPDGVSGSAVYRTVGAPRQASTRGSEVLAVRPRDFASVVYWREDFGGTPTEVFGALGDGSPVGIELPMGTTAITAFGVPAPGTWLSRSRAEETGRAIDSSYHLMLRLNDGLGRLWTFASPTFDNGGWTEVSVFLGPSAARNEPFVGGLVEPLQLQAVWIEREPISTEPARLAADTVYLTEITAVSDTGNVVLDELISTEFEAVGGIESNSAPGDQPAEDYYREIPEGESRPASLADSPFAREGTVTAWNFPTRSYNQAVPYFARPLDPIPVLVDSEAAAIGGLSVGATATFGIDGLQLPGVVIGTVEQVPTATDARNQGLIVTDLDILMSWLNHAPRWSLESAVGPQFAPGEIWLSASDPEGSAAQIAGQTEEETVIITAAGTEAAFSSRPVQIGLVSILFVGAAAGVVLALAGVIGYVLIAVQRRTREMGVLRAIGFRQRSVAATFAVEQLVVLGVGSYRRRRRPGPDETCAAVPPAGRGSRRARPASADGARHSGPWALSSAGHRSVGGIGDRGDAPRLRPRPSRGLEGGGGLMAAVVECENLIKIHKQGSLEVIGLQGLDFTMEEGEFVAVVGPSGAGKSSLLQILAGMDQPSAGRVSVAETQMSDISSPELLKHFRRNVGFVWQDYTRNLVPYLSVLANVELPMVLGGVGRGRR
ncbi:MAG: ATP-binding cassette domain-containing protein, partial [Acidimicrobiia bacterium]|nr:ATP-binding cassette domain-containing protein [Acidimicrobiia bacterium]